MTVSHKKTKNAKKISKEGEVVCGSQDEGRDLLCALEEGGAEEEEGTEVPPRKKIKKEKRVKGKKQDATSDGGVQNADEVIATPNIGIRQHFPRHV